MKRERGQHGFIYTTLLALIVVLGIALFSTNQSFAANDLATQLEVLKKLQDDGVINQEEFDNAKAILLEKDQAKTETEVASLPKDEGKRKIGESVQGNLQVTQTNVTHSKRVWEKMEIIYKDYKFYISRPGTIKVRRISDNEQLLVIHGDMRVTYYNNSEDLFDISIKRKVRPTIEEDITVKAEELKKTLKNPLKKIKQVLTPKKLLKKEDRKETKPKEEIKLILKMDGLKLLHWEGRWVPKYKAFFYQVLTSGYEPFHFYIVMQGRPPFALNMKFFNMRIDQAIRKAKTRLALEYDITEAQIDKIIEEQTGRATEEAAQEAIAEAVSAEVEAAVAQSVGEAMSAGLVEAIEQATGDAIDDALEAELAAAIDAEIAYAVSQGIEEAAVTAGWQAYFDTLAAGGSVEQASANAYEACGSACDNY